ncbi:DUF523 and DUF1722 domain-containing protein [Pleionea sediminis]|uniref:DUF523 and DUF1722 domain-containing protein n=1 Tax=Pleionea sediminis TaxID=2569479 RepID=UPI0013DDC239|nr:DUF523 domain-containing protein [Pleionea sediminis]
MMKPQVMISQCLIGDPVRYDGKHKIDDFIINYVMPFMEIVPNCPEVACGMPTPRPPIQIIKVGTERQLVNVDNTHINHSTTMAKIAHQIAGQNPSLCGLISKSKSPSCGIVDTPVKHVHRPEKTSDLSVANEYIEPGNGFFIEHFKSHLNFLPIIDENQIKIANLRHRFLTKAFTLHRWYLNQKRSKTPTKSFIANHRLLLTAYCIENAITEDNLFEKMLMSDENSELSAIKHWIDIFDTDLSLSSLAKTFTSAANNILFPRRERVEYQNLARLLHQLIENNDIQSSNKLHLCLAEQSHRTNINQLSQSTLFRPYPKELNDIKE